MRPSRLAVVGALVLGVAGRARADDAPPPVVPVAAPSGATVPDPNDAILRRVLRSGCRDGVPEVRALAANGAASWAETVGRLCGEILGTPQAQATPSFIAVPEPTERDGRVAIVFGSSVYGVWIGIATDVLLSINDVRGVILGPLLGMAAGLGVSLLVTESHPIENGQSWTIITGMEYGSINGALWGGGLNLSSTDVVGTALATGLASTAIGVLVADKLSPHQGDVEVVRSGLLWGTFTGLLGMAVVAPNSSSPSLARATAVSMDLGFLAGLAFAASFDVSRNRDLVIDAGTLGGGFLGFGVTWIALAGPDNGRALAGGTLAGLYAGMIASIYLTRHLDRAGDDAHASPVAALLGRDTRGRWAWGSPGATPVLDGNNRRVIGATFTALGGTF